MKRLNLEAFQTNNLTTPKEKTDLLLGQTLGNCHDGQGPVIGRGPVFTGKSGPVGIDNPFGN